MKTAQKNMYLRPKAKLNKRNINKDILNNGYAKIYLSL